MPPGTPCGSVWPLWACGALILSSQQNGASVSVQLSLFNDYDGFVEKFKPKKTTDDCYTPPEVYEVVLEYVENKYGIDRNNVVRPFYPGGDFESEDYDGRVVVDNPPFSILAAIVGFYVATNVPFFLFAPSMTCFSSIKSVFPKACAILCNAQITYENGAVVPTAFVTNMEVDGSVLVADGDLGDAINDMVSKLNKAKKKHLPKYIYPDHVMTASKANWFAAHHTSYKLNARDCIPITKIDAMSGKGIFGSGLLLSDSAAAERVAVECAATERAAVEHVEVERAAAERAAAERAAAQRYELSARELDMVKAISERNHPRG